MLVQFRTKNRLVMGGTNQCSPQPDVVLNLRVGNAVTRIHDQVFLEKLFEYCWLF